MSSCLVLYNDRILTMCGDSAVCYSHNGEVYRVDTNTQKITQIGNKVLFICGLAKVADLVEKQFELSNRSVEELKDILANTHKIYKPFCSVEEKYYNTGAVLGTWENGKPVVYTVESTKNFEIERNVAEDDTFCMIIDGVKKEVVKDIAEKQFMLMQRGIFNGIPNFYKRVYDRVASEEIGGKLTVYAIQNGQPFITLLHNIKEPKKLKMLTDVATNLGDGHWKFHDTFAHHIKDDKGRLRAQMGKIDGDRYGLMLKDSQGDKTVIDENGILQTYSFVAQDNLDSTNSLVIPFYIDDGTHEVRECKVNLMLDNFRAYSKAASSGGGATSSSGGSHRHVMYSKYNGGGLYNYNQGLYQFPSSGDGSAVLGLSLQIADFNGVLPNGVFPSNIYTLESAGNHSHTVPNHTHGIDYGIYKGSKASNVGLNINSHNIASGINSNTQVDISPYVAVGWNMLEITSSSLGRIVAGVFLKLFVTT